MSGHLHERYHEAEPTYSFEDPITKGDLALDVYIGQPTDEGTTVIAYHRRPTSADIYADGGLLRNIATEDQEFAGTIVNNTGHSSPLVSFGDINCHQSLVETLGYKWQSETSEEGALTHTWISFTYPSVDRINVVLDQISPNEGVRLDSHPGGAFTALELAEAITKDKILVAGEQPYQLHDHANLHILGYLGLHGELLKSIKDFAGVYLERYKAERLLPPVPSISDRRINEFLHPSYQVLRGLTVALDQASSGIGRDALIYDEEEARRSFSRVRLESSVRGIYYVGNGRLNELPSNIFERPDYEDLIRYSIGVELRYKKLAGAVIELAA